MTILLCRGCGSQIEEGSGARPDSTSDSAKGSTATPPPKKQRVASSLTRMIVVACLTVIVLGCSKTIDGSSLESFAESLKQISADLPPEARKKFDDDLMSIGTLKQLNVGQLRSEMDGMSAAEVHKIAEATRAQARERRKQDLRKQVTEIQARLDDLQRGDEALAKVHILEVGQLVGEDAHRPSSKIIELPVKNDSAYTVTSVSAVVPEWKYLQPARFLMKAPTPPGGTGVAIVEVYDLSSMPALPMKLAVKEVGIKGENVDRMIPTSKGVLDGYRSNIELINKEIQKLEPAS